MRSDIGRSGSFPAAATGFARLRASGNRGPKPPRSPAVQWQATRSCRSPSSGRPPDPGLPSKETHAPMTDTLTGTPALDAVTAALATVQDPEINRPLTELGMVKDVQIGADGAVRVEVYLTVSGCPMRETITNRVTQAVSAVPGVTSVQVGLDVMSDEQRAELRKTVRGTDAADPVIPFAQPGP